MNTNSKAVVLGMARTPFGKLGGGLAPLSATTLGAIALTGAIERSKIDPSEIEHVSFGEVLQAGVGQNPARQVLFKAGLAKTVTADTVNKVCASGLLAVVNAKRAIDAGAFAVVAAGGMESMSNAPYLLRDARWGYRFGDGAIVDAMICDGLWDQNFGMTMSTQGSKVAGELGLTREEQDTFNDGPEWFRHKTSRMTPHDPRDGPGRGGQHRVFPAQPIDIADAIEMHARAGNPCQQCQ